MTDLYQALLKAQGEMPPVKETSTNPHFKSRYADLETVIDTVTPVLHRNGLLFTQGGEVIDGKAYLATTIIHAESGNLIVSHLPIAGDHANPQAMGSSLTYCKRYGLLAMLGLATEDDDANGASPAPRPSQTLTAPPQYTNGHQTPNGNGNGQRPPAAPGTKITEAQIRFVWKIAGEKSLDEYQVHQIIEENYGVQHLPDLERRDASALIDLLKTF